jgi:hypothetical protein
VSFGARVVKTGATVERSGQNHSLRHTVCASGLGETLDCPHCPHKIYAHDFSRESRGLEVEWLIIFQQS